VILFEKKLKFNMLDDLFIFEQEKEFLKYV